MLSFSVSARVRRIHPRGFLVGGEQGLRLVELSEDLVEAAGFPPGVVNVLPGTAEAGNRLVTHPLVRKVSFTGGLPTATKIHTACAETAKPVVLELGGKSAHIAIPLIPRPDTARSSARARWTGSWG